MSIHAIRPTRETAIRAAFILLLAVFVVLGIRVGGASGLAATQLGKAGKTPDPTCPASCFVFAKVTGFQTTANGKHALFKIPEDGHIVAWQVRISTPASDDIASLTGDYGKSAARLSVLKQKDKNSFKLTKESPKVDLTSSLGSSPIYTLGQPLKVKKGSVVALSTDSWVSNFAQLGDLTAEGDKWRASRGASKCGDDPDKSADENRDDLLSSKPQLKLGTTRPYGCTYGSGRILYWAYFVPDSGK
jgi:hypothetical protein